MAHLYKSRLQNYAQKRGIPFPMYSYETQGPPHARLFKARVSVDGDTYEGLEFCTTLKDAEQAAAKVAFMSLSLAGPQEEDCLYKSLLQELAQKKGLLLPAYATNRTGPPHMPSFVSNVEIAGESFVGHEAGTKKQAEMNAAKVAYSALTEGVNIAPVSPNIEMVGTSDFGSSCLQPVVTDKKEPNRKSSTDKMQTSMENGQGKAQEKHILTLEPVVIHESQPNPTLNVVNAMQLNIRRQNLLTQGGRTHEDTGSESNGKNRSLANDGAPNSVMDSGTVGSPRTKIVIRPHKPGMTYEGPIQCADDEWVAMLVNMMKVDSPDDPFAFDVFS